MLVVMSIPHLRLPTSAELLRLFLAHLRYMSGAEYFNAFLIGPKSDFFSVEEFFSLAPDYYDDAVVPFYGSIVDDLIPNHSLLNLGHDSSCEYVAYKFE